MVPNITPQLSTASDRAIPLGRRKRRSGDDQPSRS